MWFIKDTSSLWSITNDSVTEVLCVWMLCMSPVPCILSQLLYLLFYTQISQWNGGAVGWALKSAAEGHWFQSWTGSIIISHKTCLHLFPCLFFYCSQYLPTAYFSLCLIYCKIFVYISIICLIFIKRLKTIPNCTNWLYLGAHVHLPFLVKNIFILW